MFEALANRLREAAARANEAAVAAQAAQAAQARAYAERMRRAQGSRPGSKRLPGAPQQPQSQSTPSTSRPAADAAARPDAGFGSQELAAPDFPTSIDGAALAPAGPLLEAFGSQAALLGAIVLGEALAPPIALR